MIKIFEDNGRIVIIIENDDNINMQKFTEEITKKAMSLSLPVAKEEVIGLEPVEVVTEDIDEIIAEAKDITSEEELKIIEQQMIEQVEVYEEVKEEEQKKVNEDLYDANYLYPGENPIDAILSGETLKEKDSVCVELYCSCKNILNKNLKKLIVEDLKQYIKKRFNDLSEESINKLSREEIKDTLIVYEPVVKNSIKYVLAQAGYSSVEAFLDEADDINVISAYYAIISNLLNQAWLK